MKFSKKIKLSHPEKNKVCSAESPPLFIAEIGLNHNGDLDTAKRMIAAAKNSGADFVKFQAFFPEDLFIKKFTPENLWEIFERCSLKPEQLKKLADESKNLGVGFAASVFHPDRIDVLIDLKSSFIKIASGDIVNPLLLKAAAKSSLPVLLSSGASSTKEINNALLFLEKNKLKDLLLLYCVSLYPTTAGKLQLNKILKWQKKFSVQSGFSDHTEGYWAAPLAVALGAKIIEKHFTTDKNLPGPDNKISANEKEFSEMVKASLMAFEAVKEKKDFPNPEELAGHKWGRRGLYTKKGKPYSTSKPKNLKKLHKMIQKENLLFLRPSKK